MRNKNKQGLQFKNPVIAAQVLESPFVPDSYLGHTMPPGKDFIGESDYIDMEDLIREIKKSKKKIILNIGDSSTSGWDSNVVTANRERMKKGEPLIPAFFQYKTYSDYLRTIIGTEYIVVNAGVPAHTSLQGSKRLEIVLQRFKKENIDISWVTVYYGNNDSVWDHNRQDKEWVDKKIWNKLFNLPCQFFQKDKNIVVTRVSPQDYKSYTRNIIELCENNNIGIIIIEPLTPIYWKPGTRVKNEDLERNNYPGSKKVYQLLDDALCLWKEAIRQIEFSNLKFAALEAVREKDYIVPRIKKDHLSALRELIQETEVAFIQITLDRKEDDIQYFVDYCHPIKIANELVAQNIADIIMKHKTNKPFNFSSPQKKNEMAKNTIALPTTHYTLF